MVNLKLELPVHFLEEEVRDGYTVSVRMKKIWAVELDLLNEFIRVCKKYNIKFFAAGGTILGAVRHKGFVPWDDDIDVMLFRKDYNRLCEVGLQEFQHPYFFQTHETDPDSYRGHAQLRNSETTGILKSEYYQKRKTNQGIFIDIFPLDNVPDSEDDRRVLFDELNKYKRKINEATFLMYPFKISFRRNIYALVISIFKHCILSKEKARKNVDKYYKLKEEIVSKGSKDSHKLVMSPFSEERWVYEAENFANIINMPYEMLSIPIPAGYDNMLNKTYGNWREFVKGDYVHGGVIFDTDRPYISYFK